MPMNLEDIQKAMAAWAASGTLDQAKRALVSEASALLKFYHYRVGESDKLVTEAKQQVDEIKQVNTALQAKMAGMLALQQYFRVQMQEMIALDLESDIVR